MTLTHYSPDPADAAGLALGAPAPERRTPSGRTERPQPNLALGHAETVARRSRKGRSTYDVLRRHHAHVVGIDPFRDVPGDASFAEVRAMGGFVSVDESTAADWADAWCRLNGHEIEPVVGTAMGLSWEAITHVDNERDGTRTVHTLAQHRTDLGGGFIDLSSIVVSTAVHADHRYRPTHSPGLGNTLADAIGRPNVKTSVRVKRFPWGVPGRKRRTGALVATAPRSNDPTGTETALRSFHDRIVVRKAVPRECERDERGRVIGYRSARTIVGTAPTETVSIGHDTMARPTTNRGASLAAATARKVERATERRDAATGCANGSAVLDAWETAPRGEPTTIVLPAGGTLTFRRPALDGVPFRWTLTTTTGETHTATARTPAACAMRLATIGA